MLTTDFIRKAGNAWRSAACELQNIDTLRAAHDAALQHEDLYSLTKAIKEGKQGLSL